VACVDKIVGQRGPMNRRAYVATRQVSPATLAIDVRAVKAFYRWRRR
jgi:hypothetical protein